MKLIRLKIRDKFRSLIEDFEISFREPVKNDTLNSFHPFCFAGLNGSGKSNVLEALSSIFYHLECIVNDYPVFAYDEKESKPNEFEIEYFVTHERESNSIEYFDHIFIRKEVDNAPEMSINNGKFEFITKSFGKSYLPDLVVAYSSGENETISLPYVKMKLFQYDQYIKDLRDKVKFEKPKSSLLYIDYEMSQAVLLTILLFFDFGDESNKDVLDILREEMGIAGMQQFTINLNNNWQEFVNEDPNDNLIEALTVHKKEDERVYIGQILDYLQDHIDKLKDCSTCQYERGDYTAYSFLVDENTKRLIRRKFSDSNQKPDPYSFFSIFQILHSLNERVENNEYKYEIYNSKGFYTDYKRPAHNHFFYFTHYYINKLEENKIKERLLRELSDGEQQFLHTLGICLMLQNKRTLLLLDEPETHFNPEWRSKFIDTLRKTLQAGNDNFLLKDIILTSHSPFIISDCYPDKVIVFTKGEQPESASEKEIETFGTSVNLLTNKIFNQKNTIGKYALEKIELFRDEAKAPNVDIDNLIKRINNELGDSIEKLILLKEISKIVDNDL